MTDNLNIPHLISELGNPNQEKRHEASNALKLTGAAAVEPLIAALQNTDEDVRRETIQILEYIHDERAVPAFLRTIHDDPVRNVQTLAITYLYRFVEAPGVMDSLVRVARDDTFSGKRRAAVQILKTNKKMDGDFWLEVLNDSDEMVVIIAIRALVQTNDPRTANALRITLGKWAANDGVIYNIFNNWMALDKKPTFEDVAPYLSSSDDITRGRAAWILGKIGDLRAIDLLNSLLQDKAQVFKEDNYAPYQTVSSLAKTAIEQIQKVNRH